MNKKQFIFFLFLLCGNSLKAQFNTVRPPIKEPIIEKETIENLGREESIDVEDNEISIPREIPKIKSTAHRQREFLSLPIDSLKITSAYGDRIHPIEGRRKKHNGIDLAANNDYIYSIMPGTVTRAGNDKRLGNFIEVEHGSFKSIYGHLQTILVNIKQSVEAGQPIAISGNTGNSTGEHLHFSMKHDDVYIDPEPVLNYIYDLINFVKTDLSDQIDSELRKK